MTIKYFTRLSLFVLLTLVFSCQQRPGKESSASEEGKSQSENTGLNFEGKKGQVADTLTSEAMEVNARNISGEELSPEEKQAIRESRQFFDQGVRKLKQKQYLESIEFFDKVLELQPENSRALYNRGLAYYHLDMYSEARLDFNNSIRLNPEDSSSFLYLGMMKYFNNDFNGAIEEYNKSIGMAPYYANAYYNRGLARGRLYDLTGAIEDFDRALEINPNNEDYYFNKGLALFLSGDTLQACKNWQDARALGSSQAVQAIQYYCEGK